MVKAVDHDLGSSTSTVAWEGAKGAAKGGVLSVVIGAVVIGALIYGAGALLLPASLGGISFGGAGTAFLDLSLAGKVGVVGAAIGTAAGLAYSGIASGIGAAFGLVKGGSRVKAENAKYEERSGARGQALQAQMQQVQMAGAQMGYERGVRDAQMVMAQRLQEMQMAAIQEHMAATAEKNVVPSTKHVDAELKRREAAAAAATQRI